jgi:hypothetical protein
MDWRDIDVEKVAAVIAIIGGFYVFWLWINRQLKKLKTAVDQYVVKAIAGLVQDQLDLRLADLETDKRQYALVRSLINRGMIRAEKRRMITVRDEPSGKEYVLGPEVRNAFGPIIPMLQKLYQENPGLNEAQFGLLLAGTEVDGVLVDDWLVEHICKVLDLENLECWKFAYIAATRGAKGLWDSDQFDTNS